MRVLYVTLAVFIADQVSKIFIKGFPFPIFGYQPKGMLLGHTIPILGNWCNFTFVENPHMAFSLDFGGKPFLIVFSLIASLALTYYLYLHRTDRLALRLAFALILAGAVGNLADRIFFGVLYGTSPLFTGSVVDFIDFDLFTVHMGSWSFKFWPIFNVADISISVGVGLLFLFGMKIKPQATPVASSSADAPVGHTSETGDTRAD